MHAVQEMFAETETITGPAAFTGERSYVPQASPVRWSGLLVREQAPDRWPEEKKPHRHRPASAPIPLSPSSGPAEAKLLNEVETEDPDELFLLGERCAQAYMEADTLHYRAMVLLAAFHHREGWKDTGLPSTAEWLAWRVGLQLGAARERLRTALALEQLPQTSEALRTGEVSFTKVRALTRVATAANEGTLLDFARAGSAATLERMVRGWKTLDRRSEITAEQIRHRSRRLSAWVDTDGMVVLRGRLDPEAGALVMRAVEAATDALYRQDTQDTRSEAEGRSEMDEKAEMDKTTPDQRRADALGLLAERALAAGFGRPGEEGGNGGGVISGSRAERYQVLLHVDAATLNEEGGDEGVGRSELEDGTRVSAETSRRVSCDAGLVTIAHAADGQVLGAGPRKRTVPPSVRRALEARDRGCRFPGCGLRFTDAHHVKHWADGGESSLRNLVLLCRRHHRVVHEGGVRVCLDVDGRVVFFTPRGKPLLGAPPVGEGRVVGGQGAWEAGDTESFIRRPAYRSGAARWKRDDDIPWDLEARAWEALDSG